MSGGRRDRGRWICVDGVEGAGKTTLATALVHSISAVGIAEFSDTPIGAALRQAVQNSPHFISASPLGQSLVFLGDFIELYESRIAPALGADLTVVTDRGWLSKYAYQMAVLQVVMPSDMADRLLSEILRFVPMPELTVCLTAPASVIRGRLQRRDGHCDNQRMDFIASAEAAALDRLVREPLMPHRVLRTNRPRVDVLAEALRVVAAL